MELHVNDILTRVTRYNLIRNGRMIYIDVHRRIQGKLAGDFIAVPNLVNIIATPEHQGAGTTETAALEDCLKKIKGLNLEDLFPSAGKPGPVPGRTFRRKAAAKAPDSDGAEPDAGQEKRPD